MTEGLKAWLWIIMVLGCLSLVKNIILLLVLRHEILVNLQIILAIFLLVLGCWVILYQARKYGLYLLFLGAMVFFCSKRLCRGFGQCIGGIGDTFGYLWLDEKTLA